MIVLLSGLLGVIWGAVLAKRRGGNRKDMAQYAFGFGVMGALIGLIVSIVLVRIA